MGNISVQCSLCLETANIFKSDVRLHTLVYPVVAPDNNLKPRSPPKEGLHKQRTNSFDEQELTDLQESPAGSILNKKITLKDIHIKRDVGRGAFGKVVLIRIEGIEDMYFAMKVIKKPDVIKLKLSKCITLEKEILRKNKSPFLVKLYFAFQTNSKLYLIMEYVPGGDFYKFLRTVRRLSEDVARFYLAEVILALEYLHEEMGIIYRDLKPENILITENGHLKLSDFGLSREDSGDAVTFAGTAEYTAPEIIQRKTYTKSVDYWSLGVLAYEMMVGESPFSGVRGNTRNIHKIHNNIILNAPNYPSSLSSAATDFIKKLLVSDPHMRFSGGFPEMKSHPFFAKCEWDLIMEKKCLAPIKMRPKPQKVGSAAIIQSQLHEEVKHFTGFSHVDSRISSTHNSP